MGKISNPICFSETFGLDPKVVEEAGVLDVLLNLDTNLFIDPLLLEDSRHPEISKSAVTGYRKHFGLIIKLLSSSMRVGDVAWKAAVRQFQFHEVSWTCLGYGGNTRGSGFGAELIASTLQTAKEIVDLGVTDVDLFMVLALLEDGVGADRISDMATNIIFSDLAAFNYRVIDMFGLKSSSCSFKGNHYPLLINPCSERGDPLLLVPTDIVRDLPIASDWSDISSVVSHNSQLREQVNRHIGVIFSSMTRQDRHNMKRSALKDKESFDVALEMIYLVPTLQRGNAYWF